MPSRCVIQGCPNSSRTTRCPGKIRYFNFPAALDPRYPLDSLMLKQRRELWCARLNFDENKITKNTLVCQNHFVCGKPSYYNDTENQDWAPSLLLSFSDSALKIKRKSRKIKSGSPTVSATHSNDDVNKSRPTKPFIRVACTCPNCKDGEGKRVDQNKRKSHICHYQGCGKVYRRTYNLRTHLRWHTGDRPHVCSWNGCDKQFKRSNELRRHMLIHTGEHRFQCSVCDKRFMRRDHVSQHMKIHSISSEDIKTDVAVDVANQTEPLEMEESGRVLPIILRGNRKKVKSTN